jgi:hypothetical protein
MSLPPLDRRTLMRSGATIGCCLTFIGLGGQAPALALPPANPLTGALIGWLTLRPDGAGLLNIVQTDDQSRPIRQVATETIESMGSIDRLARRASAVLVTTAADSWQVSSADCTCAWSRIEHRDSGRSIPFRIWTDFA